MKEIDVSQQPRQEKLQKENKQEAIIKKCDGTNEIDIAEAKGKLDYWKISHLLCDKKK